MAITQEQFDALPPELQRAYFIPGLRQRLDAALSQMDRAPAAEAMGPPEPAPTPSPVDQEASSMARTETAQEQLRRRVKEALQKELVGNKEETVGTKRKEDIFRGTDTTGSKTISETTGEKQRSVMDTTGTTDTFKDVSKGGRVISTVQAGDTEQMAKLIQQAKMIAQNLGIADTSTDVRQTMSANIPAINAQEVAGMDISPLVAWANTWKGPKLELPKAQTHARDMRIKLQELLDKRTQNSAENRLKALQLAGQFKGEIKTNDELLREKIFGKDYKQQVENTVADKVRNLSEQDAQRVRENIYKKVDEEVNRFLKSTETTNQDTTTQEDINKTQGKQIKETGVKASTPKAKGIDKGLSARQAQFITAVQKDGKNFAEEAGAIKRAQDMLDVNNAQADNAANYAFSRIISGPGVLTEQDVASAKPGDRLLLSQLQRAWNSAFQTGRVNMPKDIAEFKRTLKKMNSVVKENFGQFVEGRAANADTFGFSKDEAKKRIYDAYPQFKPKDTSGMSDTAKKLMEIYGE